MKYLFCRVWGDDWHDGLDLCVVPLSDEVRARIRALAQAVAQFCGGTPDVASVEFHEYSPMWYGEDNSFHWESIVPYENGGDGPDDEIGSGYVSLTEQAMDDEGCAVLSLPDDFLWPEEPRTDGCRLVFFRDARELYWQVYRKHDDFPYESCAVSPSIVLDAAVPFTRSTRQVVP